MAKAMWKDALLAQSDDVQRVEGNVYFPPAAVNHDFLRPSDKHTTCLWKGVASYYDVVVNGEVNKDAAWYYPEAKPAAKHIEGCVAFWRGVQMEK